LKERIVEMKKKIVVGFVIEQHGAIKLVCARTETNSGGLIEDQRGLVVLVQ
jgi:hypothetical protein